jgi:hypothetical protein
VECKNEMEKYCGWNEMKEKCKNEKKNENIYE